ncbi:MAG: FAD-linked oxidase C-terminal domain-containing protein [Bacteroidota bacterium]
MTDRLQKLEQILEGELFYDQSPFHQGQLRAYSTDASVYEEKPLAVAIPACETDIIQLVNFATSNKTTLIPRAAGTSLAGQVVGNGIVVDVSRHFNQVLEVNVAEKWVRVQPGVIRDDLNHYLAPMRLMFGPETSTASRAMIGGMVGNNSCGLHSIVWGAVRDHLLETRVVLSDGSVVVINAQTNSNISSKNPLLNSIYNALFNLLVNETNQTTIHNNFPKKTVVRRNTGYALDALVEMKPFNAGGKAFNLNKLIAGSEGTLAITTEIKLQLLPLPPQYIALVCVHCTSITESLLANRVALQHRPMASELVDKFILDFTKGHPVYEQNRFFIEGDPGAILMVEFMEEAPGLAAERAQAMISELQQNDFGYAYPVLFGDNVKAAWEVRKAGLGLLRNITGDAQPVNLIEDCAVAAEDLPFYIADLQVILEKYKVAASFYAHAGAGEVHVEPIINLKTKEGVFIFRSILKDTAALVKKYNGSLSGEHGDGRLRGEFIASVMGDEVMRLFKEVKRMFDPHNVFNAGKIVNTPAMDSNLRMRQDEVMPLIKTHFSFPGKGGITTLAEKCSGSGDCRRSVVSTGLMCPSYMATRNEFDTTRARANVLRQYLSDPGDAAPFNHQEIKEVMDLCLSCKGCKVECPSGVDITKMKAEFLQHYYVENGIPLRSKLIGNFAKQMRLAFLAPGLYNFVLRTNVLRRNMNRLVGFHPDRTMPLLAKQTLENWSDKRQSSHAASSKKVYLFCDEFTNYLDVSIGQKAILLLEKLGYEVVIPKHRESGRTFLSKGLLKKAATVANKNIRSLASLVSKDMPLIGIEPSAILTLRDEYIDLAEPALLADAKHLAAYTFTIEEFLYNEIKQGNIQQEQFTLATQDIVLHTHCYQKVLSSSRYSLFILSFPFNYTVKEIPSGCCGMAGSFGYEKEHYEVSQKVGELVLFPYVRKLEDEVLVAAAGTSCRHQVKDGTQKAALHPIEILYQALV